MTAQEWVKKLEEEGFEDVGIHPFEPNMNFGEHTHDALTVHVILQGSLIITDKGGTKTYTEGERVDFPAGTTHSAKTGEDGVTFAMGIKRS